MVEAYNTIFYTLSRAGFFLNAIGNLLFHLPLGCGCTCRRIEQNFLKHFTTTHQKGKKNPFKNLIRIEITPSCTRLCSSSTNIFCACEENRGFEDFGRDAAKFTWAPHKALWSPSLPVNWQSILYSLPIRSVGDNWEVLPDHHVTLLLPPPQPSTPLPLGNK